MSDDARPWRAEIPIRAIIVGAADGVGAQFARALAALHVRLVLADRDDFALARVRHELGGTAIHCDVLDERSVAHLFDEAESAIGPADLLINAAGTGYVRTLGVMRSSREFARRDRTSATFILNLASAGARDGPTFGYAGSEIAFSRLAEGLAKAIESSELKVLTLERLDTPEAITDLAEQLVRELTSVRLRDSEDKQSRLA